jgi:hypothetical protein
MAEKCVPSLAAAEDGGAGAAVASKKSKTPGAGVETQKTKNTTYTFPQKYPLEYPNEIDEDTIWRWFHQWQVWQARRVDNGKKTLFCGLCGFLSPKVKTILKHFVAEHGDKKLYSCMICEKPFCLLTNMLEHMNDVHDYSKQRWRWEWGPRKQQTLMREFDGFGGIRWDEGSDSDDDEDSEKEEESDHEYHEEHTGDTEDESDVDSEGAHDFDDEELFE